MTAATDRWLAMLLALAGKPPPPPPPIPGRRHHPKDGGRDRLAEQWELLEQRAQPVCLAPRP